jgi:hypothetical protein
MSCVGESQPAHVSTAARQTRRVPYALSPSLGRPRGAAPSGAALQRFRSHGETLWHAGPTQPPQAGLSLPASVRAATHTSRHDWLRYLWGDKGRMFCVGDEQHAYPRKAGPPFPPQEFMTPEDSDGPARRAARTSSPKRRTCLFHGILSKLVVLNYIKASRVAITGSNL